MAVALRFVQSVFECLHTSAIYSVLVEFFTVSCEECLVPSL